MQTNEIRNTMLQPNEKINNNKKKIEIKKKQKSQSTKIQYLIRRIQQSFKTRRNHRKERIRTTEIIQSEKQKIEESLKKLWDTIKGTMLAL